jgi:hypothetical protein
MTKNKSKVKKMTKLKSKKKISITEKKANLKKSKSLFYVIVTQVPQLIVSTAFLIIKDYLYDV